MTVIVRNTPVPDPDAVRDLAPLGVATVHESMGRRGLLEPGVRPIYRGARLAGRAVTVLCHAGDNLMIHAAVEVITPGDVLVVATTSASTDGMIGELLATSLRAHGCIGVVIDAGVRDVAELTEMAFPVWSRAISAQGTVKATPGSVNIPVIVGATLVNPGDVIVADDDGVVIVARQDAATVAKAGRDRVQNEDTKRQTLAGGVLGVDLYGLRGQLEQLGVRYQDFDPHDQTGCGHG